MKWGLIYWSKRLLFTIFSGFRKVRFHFYSPQFKWNQVVLLLKQWRRLLLTSLGLWIKYHLKKPQKWGLIYWCKRLMFTIFCGFRKIRFHGYSLQFKWNQVVLLLKQWRRLLLKSLELWIKYHLKKTQKWGLIYWSKRLLFTIFCGFRKIRFHCYNPQFKWNQVVLLLKNWRRLLLTSLELWIKYHLKSVRNRDWFTGGKDWCSQFFADSAKYVSTATVHSSNGIKSFFYSNNDDDFL